jgi:hypothetical protein
MKKRLLSVEANNLSANQEIPHLLQKPKIHYHLHMMSALVLMR